MRSLNAKSNLGLLSVGLALGLLFWAGCAMNAATGGPQLALFSEEQEIEMGRESDPKIVASMGLYSDESLQDYAQDLGGALAEDSERPHLPWTFRVLDEPVINAFALPGGYVYVTRGILPYLDSEAELAGVLGHEIGHVTARHSVEQISRTALAQIGPNLAGILGPRVQGAVGLVLAPLQLFDLKFSRDDEREADALGVRYMIRQGYEPRELGEVMAMLAAVSAAEGGGRIPEWLSTHPTPENREENIREAAANTIITADPPRVGTEDYLPHLEGLVFGEDPREGFFQENRFFHPGMAFEIALPEGWEAKNLKQSLEGLSPGEDALLVLTLIEGSDPSAGLTAFASKEGVQTSRTFRDPINGIPAAITDFVYEVEGSTGQGQVGFLYHGGGLFQILGLGAPATWGQNEAAVNRAIRSFRAVTDPEILNVQPARIRLVTVPRAMSLEAILRQEGALSEIEHVRRLNRLEGTPTLAEGRVLKIPSGARIPAGLQP